MSHRVDLASEAFFRDPMGVVATLRAQAPVVEAKVPVVGRVWITTTHEAAARVLKDSAAFGLRQNGAVAGLRWWMPASVARLASNMLTTDDPDHTRLRSLVDEAFRRRAVVEMTPRIRGIADELADHLFADGSPADIVLRYARIVPLSVICELLGLPLADRPQFLAWAKAMGQFSGMIGFLRMMPTTRRMRLYFEGQLARVRAEGGEGLIAELVKMEKERGQISPDEMVSMLFLLLVAGSETTTHLIGGAVFELLRDPARRDWLMEDAKRLELAVEEFLRFVSPVQFSKPRFVRHDVELDGVSLKQGDKVMAMIVAANTDPQANDEPGRLDLARRPNRHLAFGTGIHFCLGHQLARIEAACALQALFVRWPQLKLAVDPSEISWRRRPGLRAVEALPVIAA
jgi:cytochrome P450